MASVAKQEQTWLEQQEALIRGHFEIDSDIPVSGKSLFGDGLWDFGDEHDERLNHLHPGLLAINWNAFTVGKEESRRELLRTQKFVAILPEKVIEDIKRAIFLYAKFPSLVSESGKSASDKKGVTVVGAARNLLNFLGFIYLKNGLSSSVNRVQTLSDIRVEDIARAIEDYPYSLKDLKPILMLLGNGVVQGNLLYGKPSWTSLDIKQLNWPVSEEKEPIETLPTELFKLLSNTSCDLVGIFLRLMGIEAQDKQAGEQLRTDYQTRFPRFKEAFDKYASMRARGHKEGTDAWARNTKRSLKRYGICPAELLTFVQHVQTAAHNVILLYTGMRYSEAIGVKAGALYKQDGFWLLKSTVIKQRKGQPIDDDTWVAIDIVQDAIRVLEEISRLNFNRYLFAPLNLIKETETGTPKERPLSNGALSARLNVFKDKIDTAGRWSAWHLSPHQYRHGLILQLARAEVGIPYLTRQLKHKHSLLSGRASVINAATLAYGTLNRELVATHTGLAAMEAANLEVISDMYGEGRKFAGGGAAKHVERVEAFFKGLGVEGEQREQYLKQMAKGGIALVRTGVGFCTRNHMNPRELKEDPPPCIGDLKCNPSTCKHSVVPEGRKPVLIRLYKDARQNLELPEMAHLQRYYAEQTASLASMLQQLGVNADEL